MTLTSVREAAAVLRTSADEPAQELIDAASRGRSQTHRCCTTAQRGRSGHALDLHHRGIIPDDAARKLLAVLMEAYRTNAATSLRGRYGEPYNSRERHFVARIGDAAGWLHAGSPA